MNLLFICIVVCVFTADAYPQWFNEYKDTHRKLYTVEEERKAYEIIAPKYHLIRPNGSVCFDFNIILALRLTLYGRRWW